MVKRRQKALFISNKGYKGNIKVEVSKGNRGLGADRRRYLYISNKGRH